MCHNCYQIAACRGAPWQCLVEIRSACALICTCASSSPLVCMRLSNTGPTHAAPFSFIFLYPERVPSNREWRSVFTVLDIHCISQQGLKLYETPSGWVLTDAHCLTTYINESSGTVPNGCLQMCIDNSTWKAALYSNIAVKQFRCTAVVSCRRGSMHSFSFSVEWHFRRFLYRFPSYINWAGKQVYFVLSQKISPVRLDFVCMCVCVHAGLHMQKEPEHFLRW